MTDRDPLERLIGIVGMRNGAPACAVASPGPDVGTLRVGAPRMGCQEIAGSVCTPIARAR